MEQAAAVVARVEAGDESSSKPAAASASASAPGSLPAPSVDARYYACDKARLEQLQKDKPWMQNPKHFQKVAVSPSAIMKMVMHCARGVEKGIAKGGNPIEVMGLLMGRPDPEHPTTLIVTDAFPLPIEGFETRVIADDQGVVNHMIALNESLERSRNEKFMGWYHSHPFDVGDHSHCFLSQTDLSTQLQWQRAEDPHGNPFVAMVLDPLRSTFSGVPEIKAFRAFPPEYQSSVAFECPDGSIEPNEQTRLEHWGSCWNRYYEVGVEYFMSSTSRSVMNSLTQNYLWISHLKHPRDPPQMVGQLQQVAATVSGAGGSNTSRPSSLAIATSAPAAASGGGSAMMIDPEPAPLRSLTGSTTGGPSSSTGASANTKELQSVTNKLVEVATHQLAQATMDKLVKQQAFGKPMADS